MPFFDTLRSIFVNGNVGIGTSPYPDDRFKLHLYNPGVMVIQSMKTLDDSNDANIDGAINVKHQKNYLATPGYAHTYQVYAEAGMNGLILGCNDFAGLNTAVPYDPGVAAVPDGFVRFELGPLWPYSEKMRLNNQGDLIVGWELVRKQTCSQDGTVTVTSSLGAFDPSDVGRFWCWGDYEQKGKDAHADRIVAVIDSTRATVETARTVASQAGRVCVPRVLVRKGVVHLRETPAPSVVAQGTVALFVQDGALKAQADDGTVTVLAGRSAA